MRFGDLPFFPMFSSSSKSSYEHFETLSKLDKTATKLFSYKFIRGKLKKLGPQKLRISPKLTGNKLGHVDILV